ncbi:MAG: transporter [Deltaproteobacteria bacterium]
MLKRVGKLLGVFVCLAVAILLLAPISAKAMEGGPSGGLGGEDFMGGALPPPGFYYLNYLMYYSTNTVKDNNGNKVEIPTRDFKVQALVDLNRFVYISKFKILGADYGAQVIVPLVNVNVQPFTATSEKRSGVGDIVLTPLILGWHSKNWHGVFGVDAFVPTGSYNKYRPDNIGRNYWSSEIAAAFTYMSDGGFEVSSKFMFDINFKNPDTNYKSGNEFHMDALVGYHIGPWGLGVNGYYYKQVSDDSMDGVTFIDGNRGQVIGIGPAVNYTTAKHITFSAKYHKEMSAKNISEGDRFWLKVAIPF